MSWTNKKRKADGDLLRPTPPWRAEKYREAKVADPLQPAFWVGKKRPWEPKPSKIDLVPVEATIGRKEGQLL